MSTKGGTRRRIAVLLPGKHILINPSAIHTVRLLARNDYAVDLVVSCEPQWPSPIFDDPNIQVYRLSSTGVGGLRLFRDIFFSLKACLGHPIYCVIGGDPNGLIAATVLSLFKRAPVIYYSFELWFLDRRSSLVNRLKKGLERWCHARAWLTLVQDPARARLLLEENHVPDAAVVILPHAPAGPPPTEPKEDYWRAKFGIAAHHTILLHAGGIAAGNKVLELAQVAHTWHRNWVLVIHGYGEESYIRQVRRFADGKRVILSQEIVPYEQLDRLVTAADIGIALYDGCFGLNVAYIGLGSGKVLQYLRCGLPVIASSLPGLRELLTDHDCGVSVSDASQVESAVDKILSQYEMYSLHATECYVEHGNFEHYFRAVLNRLSGISV